jgi:transposase-like protein
MKIGITFKCRSCLGTNIKKNGHKYNEKQNYFCKVCKRQFIDNHALTYKVWHSDSVNKVLLMLIRGLGIRDIVEVEQISIKKVLLILVNSEKLFKPKEK